MEVKELVEILKLQGESKKFIQDEIIIEHPFTIFLNEKELVTILCTPDLLKELTVGFLFSENYIEDLGEIEKMKLGEESKTIYLSIKEKNRELRDKYRGRRTITSGCGKNTSFYNVIDSKTSSKISKTINIDPTTITQLMKKFNELSVLFKETGGVHSCALCSSDGILFYAEDIGRHNALDKVLGSGHLEGIDFDDKIVLTTGRISSEMLIKAAKRKIPIIISRSAPTSLAIDIAKELDITLIGFARVDKMNIYNNFQSIIF
ncbi:MAG: formate dehydrogenase accessory sulfurtransferase FdhD [Gudongella sp.]|nr:formate dehydrogenase accessory sulfurtransferase FdhD [Gudongella sp.]